MWTRSRFADEYVPGMFALMIDTYKTERAEQMADKLCTVKTSKKAYEEIGIRSGLGAPSVKGEGAPITFDTQIAGAKQTFTPKVYVLAVRITEEAIDDNLYELNGGGEGQLKNLSDDIGRSLAENYETITARLFNYATATTYFTTRDSVAFASASHTRLNGSTYSNKATNSDLTYLAFWSCVVAAENQYDHRQQRIKRKIKKIWYPPQLERQAREATYSPDRPDTGNRAVNAMKQSGRKIEHCNWSHMTDEDMWVLQMEGDGCYRFDNRKTRFAREKDFQTGDMMVKGDQRFSVGINDERCFYFNVP